MKNQLGSEDLDSHMPFLLNSHLWTWGAVFFALFALVSMSWMHFRQKMAVEQKMALMQDLRQARIDMLHGLIHATLSPENEADDNRREQGQALLQQAVETFERSAATLGPEPWAGHESFRTSITDFKRILGQWRRWENPSREQLTAFRISLHQLERQASEVDKAVQRQVLALSSHQSFEFFSFMMLYAFLLLGFCVAIFYTVKMRLGSEQRVLDIARQLRLAVQAGQLGLWDWDFDTGRVSYGTYWKRQLGYEDDEIGEGFEEWEKRVHPDDRDRAKQTLQDYVHHVHSLYRQEFRLRHKDGSYIWVLSQGALIPDRANRMRRMMGFHIDITERKQAEQEHQRLADQLQQARKLEAMGRLAGGVAHDLNNMITPILGYSELLQDEYREQTALVAELKQIAHSAQRARDLVHQLMAFARRQPIELNPLDLNVVVSDFQKILRRTLRENIQIDFKPTEAPCLVMGDLGQLTQVILNLSLNAQDAMPRGGCLWIGLESVMLSERELFGSINAKAGPYILLTVQDTGLGMDEQTLKKIFEPFFTTKEVGQGIGLGLATVYGIVHRMGGVIKVESQPGEGSTFLLYFPRLAQAEQVPGSQSEPSVAGDEPVAGRTILLVEDQDTVRTLACKVLRRAGYALHDFPNAESALTFAASYGRPLHLLLTDVIMPGMNGHDLYGKLCEIYPQVKVLYMSGYTSDVLEQFEGLEAGDHFIHKPFTVRSLSRKVAQMLELVGTGQ